MQQTLVGQVLLIVEASQSYSDKPRSIGLPWMNDQPVAETSDNTQHSLLTDIYASGRIRTRNPRKRENGERRFPCGHQDIWLGYIFLFHSFRFV